ncbi:MAG TPA: Tad domain-containing protein [Anaerolineae bacterium]|nr:Tad domain-containing protein [Anaerolineae bacterium]
MDSSKVHKKGRDSGQVLVVVALFLVVVTAMAALVLDGGNLYLTRRRVQNAADSGALAVAYRLGHDDDSCHDAEYYALLQEYGITRNGADTIDGVYLPSGSYFIGNG